MSKKHFVRDLAIDRALWDEYIDPSGQGGDDFNTMSLGEKMRMIIDMWPNDVQNDDDEGQRILAKIRRERKRAGAILGRIGGQKITLAKSSAARENGKKGGHPHKQPTHN